MRRDNLTALGYLPNTVELANRAPGPLSLATALKQEQRALQDRFEYTYNNPASLESDWSTLLERFPDALSAFYQEPISHVDREVHIDDKRRNRVDMLVKRELTYGFEVIELKSNKADVLAADGRLTPMAQRALRQVIRYSCVLRQARNRQLLSLSGFEVTERARVDILGFTNCLGRPARDIEQEICSFVTAESPNAHVPRLMTWTELRSSVNRGETMLFTARHAVRLWLLRALRKAATHGATAPDSGSTWKSVTNQMGMWQGALHKQLSDWREWVLKAFDLLQPRLDLLADLCFVLTFERKGDILGDGYWQHRATYRCGDALSLVQDIGDRGSAEQRRRANAVLGRAAKVIALGIERGNLEECLWFAHLARRMPTNVLQQRDIFTLVDQRRRQLFSAGDRERLWVSTNLGYMAAMHQTVDVTELFDVVRGRYDRELMRQFNLQHAKLDPVALVLNIERKTRDPSLIERRVAPWDNFVKAITTSRY